MGNHSFDKLPHLLTKNWQPISTRSNSFRNKLTNQFAHKYVLNIEDPSQLQSFKIRSKESNSYICRVLFYYQYHDSIYHVYIEEIFDNMQHLNKPASSLKMQQMDVDQWLRHKLGIIEAFWKLAQIYGFMSICRQMIGCDGNGNWKVWINPDFCSHRPWCTVQLEQQMLDSLMEVLEQIQRDFDAYEQPFNEQNYRQKNRFMTKIRQIKQQLLENQERTRIKQKKKSYTGNHSNTTNLNININIQLDGKNKQKKNDTLQHLFNPVICETSRDNSSQGQWGKYNKNKSSFGTVSFQKDINQINRPFTNYSSEKRDYFEAKNNESSRRISDTAQFLNKNSYNREDILKNRQKILKNKPQKQFQARQNKTGLSSKYYKPDLTPNSKNKTPLSILLAKKTYSPHMLPTSPPSDPKLGKKSNNFISYQRLNNYKHNSHEYSSSTKNIQKTQRYYLKNNKTVDNNTSNLQFRQNFSGNKTIPCFLVGNSNIKKNKNIPNLTTGSQQNIKYQSSNLYHKPQTYNKTHTPKNITKTDKTSFYQSNKPTTDRNQHLQDKNYKTLFQFYSKKYANNTPKQASKHSTTSQRPKSNIFGQIEDNQSHKINSNTQYNQDESGYFIRPRQNTNQNLKDQLIDILDAPIMQPISEQFEAFKNTKVVYKQENSEYGGSLTLGHLSSMQEGGQRTQNQIIKQKVEKKKATFAHLKMEVMKMLEDD